VPFVVLDALEEMEDQMISDGVLHLIGDPTSEPVLRAAGVERARALICAVDDDADNVFITLAARNLNPSIAIVARASAESAAQHLYKAGADRVVSPYVTSGRHMALAALRPRVVDYFDIGERQEGALRVDELKVEPGSGLAGRRLGDIAGKTLPLAVRRSDGELVANPPSDLKLQDGDLLLLLGERDALRSLEQ
jgi:voltage-gated potassium channel